MAVRIGFVGAGGIAGAHMNSLEKIENAQVVAFADIDEARAQKAAARFRAATYTDYRRMMEIERLDAVYVCVPPFAHTDAELIAASRGIHLFVEKPVALTMGKAREIERAISDGGIIAGVGYHWRAYDTTRRVLQELEDRTVGMVMGYWLGGLPGVPWWRRMDGSGGQMLEQTTHIVDIARVYAGEITRVYAAYALRSMHDVPNLDVPDVGSMTVHFESGAIGHIANSCMLPTGYTVGVNIITRDLVIEQRHGVVRLLGKSDTLEIRSQVNPTVVEDQAFVDAVEQGDPSRVLANYSDAIRTMAVSVAAGVSAERGAPVDVAEILG